MSFIYLDLEGRVVGRGQLLQEIFSRGPIACNVDAGPILNYTGGIVTTKPAPQKEGWSLSKGKLSVLRSLLAYTYTTQTYIVHISTYKNH